MRLYLNDKRISTAVKTKAGAVLQVYPAKMSFADEVAWQKHWDETMKPKFILKFDEEEETFAPRLSKVEKSLHDFLLNREFLAILKEQREAKAVASPLIYRRPTVSERFASIEKEAKEEALRAIRVAQASVAVPVTKKASKKTYPASEVIFNTLAQAKPASLEDWTFSAKKNFSFALPAGSYYIGDLCHALSDDVYENVLGRTGYETGIYEEKGSPRVFALERTAWDNGEFEGTDGKNFSVDAGTIGICSQSLMTKSGEGGHIYTFPSLVRCHFKMGRFTFFWDHYQSLDIKTV
jgi:hypothetical protein